MSLFEVSKRAGKSQDMNIAKKANKQSKVSNIAVKSGNGIMGRIAEIKVMVEKNLGQYKDEYTIINDENTLENYINDCIDNHYISIDTETDGLDPLQNNLAGICIYTYGQKGAYIPLNHISYVTGVKASNQLDMNFVMKQFDRLSQADCVDIDMFNAKFDIRFLRANGWKDAYCTWDGYLASRLLNENEPHKDLKHLHNKYCLDGKGDAFRFDDLFKGIPFTMIPYNVGYLYAAHDPVITTELCDYQRPFLTPGTKECEEYELEGVSWVFHNIEMPCISVVADMEDNGVEFDLNYQQELSVKYNELLKEKMDKFYRVCDGFGKELDDYRQKQGANNKLEYPINISSSSQIAIMLYDVLKITSPDKKNPRGTGEAILEKIDHPVAKAIVEYREVKKLLSTYIDKLPECINPKDGKIHCSFNQYGADTGRFSSSDPNLQNIPSHNKDIRKMFVATSEEKIISTDTQQFEVDKWCEIECADKWKYADKIVVGDVLLLDDGSCVNVCGVSVNSDTIVIDFT